MAECVFVQNDESIPYTFAADAAAGEVISLATGFLGYTKRAFANGETGTVFLKGICNVAKTSTDTYALGATVYWDATNNLALTAQTSGGSEPKIGTCVKAAASGDATVMIAFNV